MNGSDSPNLSQEPCTLWTNPSRTRYFLLPDAQRFSPGPFLICTITGGRMEVGESQLRPFEVTEDQAKQWLKSEFGKVLDGARAAADRFIADLRARTADLDQKK